MTNWINMISLLLTLSLFVWACTEKNKRMPISESEEVIAVKSACLDYVEGFFESSETRIKKSVSAELVKRIPKDGRLQEMTREQLIAGATAAKREKPEIIVEVFDIYKNIALAKVTSDFVDYVQLAKMDGKWQVVNVLWDL